MSALLAAVLTAAVAVANPKPRGPVLYTFSTVNMTQSEMYLAQSYNGLCGRQKGMPCIWMDWDGWRYNDLWMGDLKEYHGVRFNMQYNHPGGVLKFIKKNPAKVLIEGYLVAQLNDHSQWRAASLAGMWNALITTDPPSTVAVHAMKHPMIYNFQTHPMDLKTAWDIFTTDPDADYDHLIIQKLEQWEHLADLAMAKHQFIFWEDDLKSPIVDTIMSHLNANAIGFGWGNDEHDFVGAFSRHGAAVVCNDLSNNMLVFQSFDFQGARGHRNRPEPFTARPAILPDGMEGRRGVTKEQAKYITAAHGYIDVKPVTAEEDARIRAEMAPPASPASATPEHRSKPAPTPEKKKHYVAFVFSDGDNTQWLINTFFDDKWYGSPHRGEFPLTWTLSGSTDRELPVVLDGILRRATKNDDFVIGPSGRGYTYATNWPTVHRVPFRPSPPVNPMKEFAKATVAFSKNTGIRSVNMIDDWTTSEYYSQVLDVYTSDKTVQQNTDAIVYYQYQDYSGMNGTIYWSNGVPVIGGRANMWTPEFSTPAQIAAKLNSFSADLTDPEAYSVIPVHAWSMNVTAVKECVGLLEDHVEPVTLSELVKLVRKNVVRL